MMEWCAFRIPQELTSQNCFHSASSVVLPNANVPHTDPCGVVPFHVIVTFHNNALASCTVAIYDY